MAPQQARTNDLLGDIAKMGLLDAPDPLRLRAGTVSTLPLGGGPREVDEKQWKENCIDLLKVMDICKQTHLVLEHSNEAILRVAVEVATDRRARRTMWWKDGWYADEGQREDFRAIIQGKLTMAVALLRGDTSTAMKAAAGASSEDEEAIAMLKLQVKELETALAAARTQQQTAEQKARDEEAKARDYYDRIADLQKSIERLREELKKAIEEGQRPTEGPAATNDGAMDELRKKTGLLETQNKKLSDELEKLKKEHADVLAVQDMTSKWFNTNFSSPLVSGTKKGQEMMSEAKESLANAEKQLKEMIRKAQQDGASKAKNSKVERKEAPASTGPVKQEAAVVKDTREERNTGDDKALEAERRRVRQLEAELEEMQKKIKDLEVRLAEETRRADSAEEEAARARRDANRPVQEKPQEQKERPQQQKEEHKEEQRQGISPELRRELDELRKIKGLYEVQSEKFSKIKEKLKALTEERDQLQEQNDKLLKLIQQLKEQLKKIMEIAEKKGLGKQVQEILDETGLTQTLASPEFTCFDRLYEDAMRRLAKQRDIERMRLGLIPKDRSPSPSAPAVIRTAGGIVGYKGDEVKSSPQGYYVHGAYYGNEGIYAMDESTPAVGSYGGGFSYGSDVGGGNFVQSPATAIAAAITSGASPEVAAAAAMAAGASLETAQAMAAAAAAVAMQQSRGASRNTTMQGMNFGAQGAGRNRSGTPPHAADARQRRTPLVIQTGTSGDYGDGNRLFTERQGRNHSRSPERETASSSAGFAKNRGRYVGTMSTGNLSAMPESLEHPRLNSTAGAEGFGVPRRVVRAGPGAGGLSHGGGSSASLFPAHPRGGVSTLEQVVGKGYGLQRPEVGFPAGAWTETNSRVQRTLVS